MSHHKAAIVDNPDFLRYDFGPQHPLRPERITLGLDLLTAANIWSRDEETIEAAPAEDEEIALVHGPDYIRAVRAGGNAALSRSELSSYGFGPGDNPPFQEMHEAAALIVGGTVAAARAVMEGKVTHAFMPSGGLHHAHRVRASGFCIYNDPAVAIAVMQREYGARVLYIDLDCHHGDGVQWLFYDDPHVLTVSFHESGRYLFPGTGETGERGAGAGLGYAVNVPFAPFTEDSCWREALHSILPRVAEWFQPDVLLTNHGADTHVWDPLTHLALTTSSFVEQVALVHALAHEYTDGRWLAVGSGGYDWVGVVPRSWSIVWSAMTCRPLPAHLPEGWLQRWSTCARYGLSETFLDGSDVRHAPARGAESRTRNTETVAAVQQMLDAAGPSRRNSAAL